MMNDKIIEIGQLSYLTLSGSGILLDPDPWALPTAIKSHAFGVKKIIADWQCPIAD